MPETIIAGAAAIGSFFAGSGAAAAGTGFFASLGATAATTASVAATAIKIGSVVGSLLVSTAINYGLNKAFGPQQATQDFGRTIEGESGVKPHNLVYGEQLVTGFTVAEFAWPGRGNKLLYYCRVKVVAAHEIDGLKEWRVDGRKVAVDGNGFVQDAPLFANGRSYLQVFWSRGREDEPAHAGLRAATRPRNPVTGNFDNTQQPWWRETDRLRGRAWIAFVWEYDPEVYSDGLYPQVTAVIRGKKVYDPRLDDTRGGSGPQRADQPATWAYSANWSLVSTDFYRSRYGPMRDRVANEPGGVLRADRVDWDSVWRAANVSDEVIGLLETDWWERRWQIDAFIEDVGNPRGVLDSMMRHAAGFYSESGGVFSITAGAWEAPSPGINVDARYFAGAVRVELAGLGMASRFNTVRGAYLSPEAGYVPVEYPGVVDDTLKARDQGREAATVMNFPWSTSPNRARRAASILLRRQLFPRLIAQQALNLRGVLLKAGDVVAVTNAFSGLNETPMRIESWRVNFNGGAAPISVRLREEHPEIYTDPPLVPRNAGAGQDVPSGLDNALFPDDEPEAEAA